MNEKLLPCPFCGGEATVYEQSFGLGDYWKVCCQSDTGCMAEINRIGRDKAIAAWNRRLE